MPARGALVIEGRHRLERLAAVLRKPMSAREALVGLLGIAALSIAARIVFVRQVHAPFIFLDELGYEQMAKSIARNGTVAIFGRVGLSYSPLYSVALAPIYALTSSATRAYEWAKIVNAVLMTLAIFPIYGIARLVLSRGLSLGVAALSLLAPLMFYTDLVMSESLAYSLFLVAIWAMLRAVRDPGPRNDLLLLGSIVLACAARLQQLALFPAALTAIVIVALLEPGGPAARAVARSLARHWLLLVSAAVVLIAAFVGREGNGGALPLAGRYANVGTAHADALRVLTLAVQHLAGLDLAVGVAPFAGALVAAYALRRAGYPLDGLVFGSVAAAATVWLLLEVAYDAAAFDATGSGSPGARDLPRIHERYLVYLVPLFLVAFVAVLRARRPAPRSVFVAAAVAAALLPVAIPFGTVINNTIVADSFALQVFARAHNVFVPIPHTTLTAVALAGVLAASFALVGWGRAWPAIVMTIVAFLFMSSLVRDRINSAAAGAIHGGLPSHKNWVDRTIGTGDVVLIGGNGAGNQRIGLWETAFFNLGISRVYHTCPTFFSPDFGERKLTLDPVTGSLRDSAGTGVVLTRYAVVPADFGLIGQVLAEDDASGLVLVAPANGVLTVPAANRASVRCES